VDVVAGAKISMLLSRKASLTILGDAGGGQADKDYRVASFLGHKIKPTHPRGRMALFGCRLSPPLHFRL
jgi:hypothetical protein